MKLTEKIDVFLLSAGESSRMYPLSQIMEKSLLPVNGKPVIRYIINKLYTQKNIGQIFIAVLEKFENQFKHEFRDLKNKVKIHPFIIPTGTAATLYHTINDNYRDSISDWVFVHYADCLTNLNYKNFLDRLDYIDNKTHGIIAVTGGVKHDYSEVTVIGKAHEMGRVAVFKEKPPISSLTWTGIALLRKKPFMEKYCGLPQSDIASDVFPQMIEDGVLKAHVFEGFWYDCGNLNAYRKICEQYNGKTTT